MEFQVNLNQPYLVQVGKVHFSKSSCIEGQDYKIEDLLARWSQGQRLNVNMRPLDIEDAQHPSEDENMSNPPIFEDITELQSFKEQTSERKQSLIERIKRAKAEKAQANKVVEVAGDAAE